MRETGTADIEPVSAMIGIAVIIAACRPIENRTHRLLLLLTITSVAAAGIVTRYIAYDQANFWAEPEAEDNLLQILTMAGPGGVVALLRLTANAFART